MKNSTNTRIFIAAGLSNFLAVPLFSQIFSNEVITATQPTVMSNFGLVMIMVWGLSYIAVSKSYAAVPWLIAVFVLEKLAYVIVWVGWHSQNSLSAVYQQDMIAGIFYSIYGVNDFIFFILFSAIFYQLKRK